nr:hypothetical protein [Tanacetum cinerariifolium]
RSSWPLWVGMVTSSLLSSQVVVEESRWRAVESEGVEVASREICVRWWGREGGGWWPTVMIEVVVMKWVY